MRYLHIHLLLICFLFTIGFWLLYSLCVIIYLKILTKRYLVPVSRDMLLVGKFLKSYKSLHERYKNRDSLNILVLSGGGIRGMVPLYIINYIEEQLGKKAGEIFDFVSGASTGAISAATFAVADTEGNYKYSAKDILSTYEDNTRKIFSSPWYHQLLTCFGLFAPRFLPDNKLKVLDNYFGNTTIGELKGNILIPVYDMDQNRLQIIKNWSPIHGKSNDNFLVKDLVNGASNPPMLFPPIAFHQQWKNNLFIDPAVLLNNPILHVILYVRAIFPNKRLNIVLIGNGTTSSMVRDYESMFSFGLYGFYQYLFNAPSLSSKLLIEFVEEYLIDAQ